MRTVEYYDIGAEEWFDTTWSGVVSGTMIRMFEEDDTPVTDGTGVAEFYTISDSYIPTESGIPEVWTVQVNDPDPVAKRAE